jgi:spermidine synthase
MPAPAEHARPIVQDVVEGAARTRTLHFASWELQSRMRIDAPDVLDVEYTRTMMGFLLFNAQPQSIAMIGLGGGSLAKFCRRHLPQAAMAVVEINPHVIALRDHFQVPPDGPRFRIIEDDGARFVAQAAPGCDVLLVDGFGDEGMPACLATQAFYDDCHHMLSTRGVLVVNLHSQHPDCALFIGRIARSFGENVLTVNVKREGNSVVFASKTPLVELQRHVAQAHAPTLGRRAWLELKPSLAQVLACLQEQ